MLTNEKPTTVLQPAKRTPPNISRTKNSNTQRTENKTTDVVIHRHSRRLLKMDILMSETCWAHNKWNKIASDIKLVCHSSTTHKRFVSFLLSRRCSVVGLFAGFLLVPALFLINWHPANTFLPSCVFIDLACTNICYRCELNNSKYALQTFYLP